MVAEEVAKVNSNLVVRSEKGELHTVRYDAVNAMLLNEFLKEHKKMEEQRETILRLKSDAGKQEATISELKKDMEVLTARVKKQATEIRKVGARVQMTGIALNNP